MTEPVLSTAEQQELEKRLDEFFEENADPFAGGGGLGALDPPMDSITATEFLCKVEDITGKVPVTVVKEGGYQTKEEFVSEMSGRIVEHLASKQS